MGYLIFSSISFLISLVWLVDSIAADFAVSNTQILSVFSNIGLCLVFLEQYFRSGKQLISKKMSYFLLVAVVEYLVIVDVIYFYKMYINHHWQYKLQINILVALFTVGLLLYAVQVYKKVGKGEAA